MKTTSTDWLLLLLFCTIIMVIPTVLLLQPAFEARTFNKFRQEGAPKATYWDALWADLRVTSE